MFETTAFADGRGLVLGRGSVSGAVMFHSLVLAVALGVSLLARVDPGDPPPPPGEPVFHTIVNVKLGTSMDSGGGGPKPPARRAAPAPPAAPVQPTSVPDLKETPATPAAPPDEPPEVGPAIGSGPGEGPGEGPGRGPGDQGVPWGFPEGTELAPAAPPEDDEPILVVGEVEAPVLQLRVEPVYPPLARQARLQGLVILDGVIGTDGRIESLAVLRSIPLLDHAALDAVRQWVYTPARQRGHLVRVRVTIRVDFRLD